MRIFSKLLSTTKWILTIVIVFFIVPIFILIAMWNFSGPKSIKNITINGITYSLIKERKCDDNCYHIIYCKEESGVCVENLNYEYPKMITSSDIKNIYENDNKLIIIINKNTKYFLNKKMHYNYTKDIFLDLNPIDEKDNIKIYKYEYNKPDTNYTDHGLEIIIKEE